MINKGERRTVSGAIVLTIAAILLITSGYLYFGVRAKSASYEELVSRQLTIAPSSTYTYEFRDIEPGKQYEITVWIAYSISYDPRLRSFHVTISDPQGKIVDMTTQQTFSWTIDGRDGPLTVNIKNIENEALALTLRIVDVTRSEKRPFEQVSQWLALVSIPVIALGIWLIWPRKEKQH